MKEKEKREANAKAPQEKSPAKKGAKKAPILNPKDEKQAKAAEKGQKAMDAALSKAS